MRTIIRVMDIDCDETYCARCRYINMERKGCSLFNAELSRWVIERKWGGGGYTHLYLRCAECMACDVKFMRDGRPE